MGRLDPVRGAYWAGSVSSRHAPVSVVKQHRRAFVHDMNQRCDMREFRSPHGHSWNGKFSSSADGIEERVDVYWTTPEMLHDDS